MAYFSNGSEGENLDAECMRCRFGEQWCPIFAVQVKYNYEACNIPVARKILDDLIKDDGTCAMLKAFPEVLLKK
jgi:hypothetical protein